MKKWFHVFFKNRWGRGQPDDIGAINLGDEKFDPDSDKKPRAGQILWIRGLTRLQTQVTIPISLSFSLSLSIFLCHSVSLFLILSLYHHSTRFNILLIPLFTKTEIRNPTKKKNRPRIQQVQVARPHESHTVLLNVLRNSQDSFFSFLFFFLSFNSARATIRRSYARRTYARVFLLSSSNTYTEYN